MMEDAARADTMANSLQTKDNRSFWSSVSKQYNKSIPLATTVDKATDPQSISNVWKEHFEGILNSVRSETHKQSVVESISSDVSKDCFVITPSMVAAAIDKLKPGKSCGNYGLAAEHFKYSDSRINVLFFVSLLLVMYYTRLFA